MSRTARRLHHTIGQYIALEEESSIRHEYLAGEIYALAGGSPDHAALAATVIQMLGAQMPPGCRVFTSDLRVRIPASGLSTYPDVAVVCGRTERAQDDARAVTNPILLVEVTSDSTEDYDRAEKLRHYKQLPSLHEILIVSHREPHLTVHRRQGAEWSIVEARAHETIDLLGTAAHLPVDEIYEQELEDLPPTSD